MTTPNVVIAASPHERIAALVLEHTIRKHASGDVNIVHTFDRDDRPSLGVYEEGGTDGTRFTWVRLWVPELMNHQGRAIYLDSDMIVFDDIQQLFDQPMGLHPVCATPQDPSVLLIDCEQCRWPLHEWMEVAKLKGGTLWHVPEAAQAVRGPHLGKLPPEWNVRDVPYAESYVEGETKLYHYTNMNTQPWPNHRHGGIPEHPCGYLWWNALRETVESGLLSAEELPESLQGKIHAAPTDAT